MRRNKTLSSKYAPRVDYTKEAVIKMFLDHYPEIDQEYLVKYVTSCFDYNISMGFVPHKRHYSIKGYRYHHVFPKFLFPDMVNSRTNLIHISVKDHFEVHCLLVYAFRDYHHHREAAKSDFFTSLIRGVAGCLGQLPKKIQDTHRDEFANEFLALTGKTLHCLDRLSSYRDYQSVRRSTPIGRAYDQLKAYCRFLLKKHDIVLPQVVDVIGRATFLLNSGSYLISADEILKLQKYYTNYVVAKAESGASHTVL